MTAPLYFFSGAASRGSIDLERIGLAHLLDEDGRIGSFTTTRAGPDRGPGLVLALPAGPKGEEGNPQLADSARWLELPGSPGVWLGTVGPVRPADLERSRMRPGHVVKLCDGAPWTVPVARRWSGETAFPTRARFDGKAWMTGDVPSGAMRVLWDAACRVWDELAKKVPDGETEPVRLTVNEGLEVVTAALALNYRVGPGELSVLELLDTDAMGACLRALIDLPSVSEMLARGNAVGAGRGGSPGAAG